MARLSPRPKTAIIKKYGNRRLYDTDESRYVTLDELEAKIRAGYDVRVLDAKSGEDLTQGTLAQIILESRGAARLMPVPLMLRLIRMGDDALAEFMSRYVTAALEIYLNARKGAQAVSPYFPMANMPFAATNALARLFLGAPTAAQPGWDPAARKAAQWSADAPPHPDDYDADDLDDPAFAAATAPVVQATQDNQRQDDELAALRRELDEIKSALGGAKKGAAKKAPAKRRAPKKR